MSFKIQGQKFNGKGNRTDGRLDSLAARSTQSRFSTAEGSQTVCSKSSSLGRKPVLSCTASLAENFKHESCFSQH